MENDMADEIQQDDDYRQGAEQQQQELELQEFIYTNLLHGNPSQFLSAWNMMESVKLSKKQAESTSTLESIG
jgi:hypothetical protein